MDPNITQTCTDIIKEKFEYWQTGIQADDIKDFSLDLIDILKETESDVKLYRYSPADYYNIRNLETGQLMLSGSHLLNDVYEGLPQSSLSYVDMRGLPDFAFLKCFSENHCSNPMWSHYAKDHTGFCVEYDLKLIPETDDILQHIFPVIYTNQKRLKAPNLSHIISEQKQLDEDMKNDNVHDDEGYLHDILLYFLFKSGEWFPEREWRIIYTALEIDQLQDRKLKEKIISFDYATGVYLGCRIAPSIKKHLMEIVQRKNTERSLLNQTLISIYEMQLSDSDFLLHPKKIEEEEQ